MFGGLFWQDAFMEHCSTLLKQTQLQIPVSYDSQPVDGDLVSLFGAPVDLSFILDVLKFHDRHLSVFFTLDARLGLSIIRNVLCHLLDNFLSIVLPALSFQNSN